MKPFFLHVSDIPTSDIFFRLVKKYFSTKLSFRLVETDFLANGNRFLPFSQTLPVEAVSSSTGTYFLANPLFRLVKMSHLFTGNSILLFQFFLY